MKTLKGLKNKQKLLEIKGRFMSVDTRPLDSKHRITLNGKWQRTIMSKMKIDSYQIFVGERGDILLRPAVSISSNEAWVYQNPKVIGKVRQGLQEAGEGKIEKVDNLEDFLDNL
ncbi:MAG: hypothetical protein ABIH27_02315 [Candidatus Omnitrophota bacterium]